MQWSRVGQDSFLVTFREGRGEARIHNSGEFQPEISAKKDNARKAI